MKQLNYINYTIKLNMEEWPRLIMSSAYRIRKFGLQACYKSLNFERYYKKLTIKFIMTTTVKYNMQQGF